MELFEIIFLIYRTQATKNTSIGFIHVRDHIVLNVDSIWVLIFAIDCTLLKSGFLYEVFDFILFTQSFMCKQKTIR